MRGLAAVVTAVAMLTLGVFGGMTYLWCAPMQEARLHCCCPEEEGDATQEMVRRECCEARVVANLPAGAAADPSPTPLVAPPALDLTWLAALDVLLPADDGVAVRGRERARAGPRLRLHRRYSVDLV